MAKKRTPEEIEKEIKRRLSLAEKAKKTAAELKEDPNIFDKIYTKERLREGGNVLIKPPTDFADQNILADELVTWALGNTNSTIEDFPLSKRMAPRRFYAMALPNKNGEINEYFASALEFSRYVIGSKIQKEWREKAISDFASKMMPLYNKEFHDYIIAKSKDENLGNNKIIVEMKSFESSLLVPNKKS